MTSSPSPSSPDSSPSASSPSPLPGSAPDPLAAPDSSPSSGSPAAPDSSASPAPGSDAGPRSGLRNPQAAVRGLGAGTLVLEAIVLLLGIQPIRIMGGDLDGWGIAAVVFLAVFAVVLAGMMRRPWAWTAGTVLQALLLAGGFFHWSLTALGLIFGAAWVYALYVRRTILG
ncbi:DUF4233 domain-containing protein [Actinoplanes sp. LDG1-06]|uniref:DUF4233 domain-containing protein n=1 Tax=Paractinoplanes ovalisporus TaxID=2810368 RepID=A0ABS2APB2_9ACTN|nr:DUF4233 domain-containing protein [Actinoplanes ovalisporus]MBM2621660.1 DUF4233 domain-containing protein [Actinoplanes ovalisporus]